jgi:hypothetical protein
VTDEVTQDDDETDEKSVSLHPLDPKEALADLMKVKPAKKEPEADKDHVKRRG